MIQGVSFNEMIEQSINVLTSPNVATFEKYEKKGGQQEALTYIGAAAVVAGVVAFVFNVFTSGIGGAIAGLILGVIGTLVGFYIFAFVLYFVAQQQGGTGTQNEVFYSAALYSAPLVAITRIVSSVPVLGCLLAPATLVLALYQAYLGYVAARSSMNIDQTKAIISVVAAILAQIIVGAIITGIVGGILFGIFAFMR